MLDTGFRSNDHKKKLHSTLDFERGRNQTQGGSDIFLMVCNLLTWFPDVFPTISAATVNRTEFESTTMQHELANQRNCTTVQSCVVQLSKNIENTEVRRLRY